ncbi:putative inner membrane protein translocase component YidC [Actinobacillus equuli]|nr:putative inner membrane protein translocase component YidC [Actinobacillus equuli]
MPTYYKMPFFYLSLTQEKLNMNSNRSLLVLGLLLVSFLVFTQWQQDFNPEIQAQKQAQQQAQVASQSGDVPAASNANTVIAENATQGKTITIQSDVLRLTIDTLGGDVIASDLLAHNAELILKHHLNYYKPVQQLMLLRVV